ncbi:hypothetical protein Poli38472_004003 [Pythium oligandrum]|uniref:B-block binding subunit of TFIIIC domain-containing protein n=1 Tax=Pythium oligandrum TaxID=41045 RepID=A0A8K1FQ41_PYTOL|nr:hypothetical protein Poli38472_004003 [Pythium oligandrum]|eukprot:TMW66238.1 hypothetical protein Poli38472_004003 [Pythium oligandrum]
MTQALAMPQFVARCLEEIGLEGRCGMALRDLFALVDEAQDERYRQYAWRVLRTLNGQLQFHYMLFAHDTAHVKKRKRQDREASVRSPSTAVGAVEKASQPKRRRMWSTTLLHDATRRRRSRSNCEELSEGEASGEARSRRRRRSSASSVVEVAMTQGENGGGGYDTEQVNGDVIKQEKTGKNGTTHSSKRSSLVDDEHREWVIRSSRGYRLGEQVDVTGLSFEDAMAEAPDGVLGIVACRELRLKYLGIVDASGMDEALPQFDLLEMIGRARIQGVNAALLAGEGIFGDARKLHYLLDVLIASGLVEKNIVTADQRRFNIVHLTRFAHHFDPSLISPAAVAERDCFPKEQLPHMIVQILLARGERTCVFADIGRELGYGKRHQEKLRKYFFQQMHVDPNFPLEMFTARCNTGSDTRGRKLWCVRIRSQLRGGKNNGNGDGANPGSGPVIERGIMEQMFASIQDRQGSGATIPELRDMLGVPTFKLPYKLAQGLISSYNLTVEQVVLGKSTMYRMFAPGVSVPEEDASALDVSFEEGIATDEEDVKVSNGASSEVSYQPSTMKEATRGVIVGSTAERRKQYIIERVMKERIISLHQLRAGLISMENPQGKPAIDVGTIDIRSVRRILNELEEQKLVVTMDITLPPKRVLQKNHRVVKCVALPEAQRDREALRAFIDTYLEEQQRKFMENLGDENDAFIVVSNRRPRKRGTPAPDLENKEVVKYSATSYKLARFHLVKLHKQCRRLGMYFGVIYRCRGLHLLMWERMGELKAKRDGIVQSEASDGVRTRCELVFALKEFLDLLTVGEYIHIVGVSELLTEMEENRVRMAIARGDSWEALSPETCSKIRDCEADRFSRLLRVLIELELIQVVNDSSHDLLSVMRSTDDFDQVISQVAFATLSGGLFRLKERTRIAIKLGNKLLKQLPTKESFVYAAGFSDSNRSEQLSGRIPLDFQLQSVDDAKEFWRALRFMSLEGARLGTGSNADGNLSVDIDGELVRSAPLRDHNIYTMKVWIPKSTTNNQAKEDRKKVVASAVGAIESFTRKRVVSSGVTSATGSLSGRAEKVQRLEYNQVFSSVYQAVDAEDGAAAARWRKLDEFGGAKSVVRASKWSKDEDMSLMDHYIEMLSSQWFIDVPLALQRHGERVAFRTTSLTRTKTAWKLLGEKMDRKPNDCMQRVKELMSVPAVQARVEKTKLAVTKAKNPSGTFHEELAIMTQPRLTALLCRALQIILHEHSTYYSGLADMLISEWTESEVKLVWRYMWLAGLIKRTYKTNGGNNQRQRGFCLHSQVNEMTSLGIPFYSIEFFCDAAEYASFLQQNIKEMEYLEADQTEETNSGEPVFEQEIEGDVAPGRVAIDLASMVMEDAAFQPEYTVPSEEKTAALRWTGPTKSQTDTKRSQAVKGYAGHLSTRCGGAHPDDFLRAYWSVKAVYRLKDDGARTNTQAFSTALFLDVKKRAQQSRDISGWLDKAIEKSGARGISLVELLDEYHAEHILSKQLMAKQSQERALKDALVGMMKAQQVFEVNGYDSLRYVSRDHSSIWTLSPYQVSNDSTKEKVHFVFDKSRSIVSRPWLHLDGSVNAKVSLTLKRRVVNIIMCSPGIQDRAIHSKMHKVVSLQDTKSLLDELLAEEIIYARIGHGHPAPRSIFELNKQNTIQYSVSVLSPGELRHVRPETDRLHYFPAVNCVELLGAAACDIDMGSSD